MEGTVNLGTPKQDKPRKGRRSKFPDHLPRVTTKVELQASDRICGHCEGELHEIGQEVTRELERLETTIEHKIARAKYACRTCTRRRKDGPCSAESYRQGLAGTGFLGTCSGRAFRSPHAVQPAGKEVRLGGPRAIAQRPRAVHVADRRDIHACLRSAPPRSGGLAGALHRRHSGDDRAYAWKGRLVDRTGLDLQRPGWSSRLRLHGNQKARWSAGYFGWLHGLHPCRRLRWVRALFLPEGATEVACWAHTRRKVVEAEKTEPELAGGAIRRIGELYAIERHAKAQELGRRRTRRASSKEQHAVLSRFQPA